MEIFQLIFKLRQNLISKTAPEPHLKNCDRTFLKNTAPETHLKKLRQNLISKILRQNHGIFTTLVWGPPSGWKCLNQVERKQTVPVPLSPILHLPYLFKLILDSISLQNFANNRPSLGECWSVWTHGRKIHNISQQCWPNVGRQKFLDGAWHLPNSLRGCRQARGNHGTAFPQYLGNLKLSSFHEKIIILFINYFIRRKVLWCYKMLYFWIGRPLTPQANEGSYGGGYRYRYLDKSNIITKVVGYIFVTFENGEQEDTY